MCGIAGIYHIAPPYGTWRDMVSNFISKLQHRGPDEHGFLFLDYISMGISRLKVIDLQTGSQPISNEDETLHIICNGEIYRHDAIRDDLMSRGHHFKTQSDTEVLLHLYEEYGLDFFEYFDGMFAFALWDSQKKRLILSRDRFGIKPLFYTARSLNGFIAFASELAPLHKTPWISKQLDPIAIDQFFTLSYILNPRTIFKDIKKVKPGHYLLIEKQNVHEIQYWDLPLHEHSDNRTTILEELDNNIEFATRTMMRCDVPCGTFLSGGLDSATIAYHMARHSSKPISTFTIRFEERSFDEGKEALLISKHLGTDHHEYWMKPQDVTDIPHAMANFGEPFADPALIPTYFLSQFAKESVTVIVSGDGGDEILGGYLTYIASCLTGTFNKVPRPFIDTALFAINQFPSSMRRVSFDHKLKKFLAGCCLPPVEHHAAWKVIFPMWDRINLYEKEFAAQLKNSMNTAVFKEWEHLFNTGNLDTLTQYQYLDIKTFLTDNNLVRVDRMSMANSLEVRLPFLDKNVVNTALKLHPSLRVKGFTTKVALRNIMRDRLPKRVVGMGKKGFAVPLSFWFQNSLKKFVNETLSADRLKSTGIISPEYVKQVIEQHLSGKKNLNRQIWSLICFVHWYDHAIENRLI